MQRFCRPAWIACFAGLSAYVLSVIVVWATSLVLDIRNVRSGSFLGVYLRRGTEIAVYVGLVLQLSGLFYSVVVERSEPLSRMLAVTALETVLAVLAIPTRIV